MKYLNLIPLIYWLLMVPQSALSAEPEEKPVAFGFSGFVDLRFRDINSSVQGQGRGAESGFLVEDAAGPYRTHR